MSPAPNPPTPWTLLMPGGVTLGTAGSDPSIREVPGGVREAQDLFDDLTRRGIDVTPPTHPGKLVALPGGGFIGLRLVSKSGPPTIDVDIPGLPIRKVKFV